MASSDDASLNFDDTGQSANESVNQMIRQTIAEVPSARMWMVSNPEIVAKQAKAKQAKERAAAKKALAGSGGKGLGKRKQKDVDADADASDDGGSPEKKARKARASKGKGARDLDTDDDADKPIFAISAYVHVLRQTVPSAPPKARAKKPEDEYLQRGPFQFQSTDTYDDFLELLAQTLPCPSPNHIASSKIMWKPQKPMKAEALPLGGSLGFSIMINELASKPSRVIILTMPPPTKPVDEVPFWDTGCYEARPANEGRCRLGSGPELLEDESPSIKAGW